MSITYKCRFIPRLLTGDLHIGHCVTYVANLLQASKTSTTWTELLFKNLSFILTYDSTQIEPEKLNQNLDLINDNFWPISRLNISIAPSIFNAHLLKRRLTAEEKDTYVLDYLTKLLWNRHHEIFDPILSVSTIDWLLQTNCFIRGKELKNDLYSNLATFFFNRMATWEYKEYWIPSLIDEKRQKISKHTHEQYSIYQLKQNYHICGAAFFLYPIFKFEGDNIPEMTNYNQSFDIEKIAGQDDWTFYIDELLEVNKFCVSRELHRSPSPANKQHYDPKVREFLRNCLLIQN